MLRWNDILESYDQYYDKFKINREYKETHWPDENTYLKAQQVLLEKISDLDRKVTEEIRLIFQEVYPDVKLVLFDSRMHSYLEGYVGSTLVEGLDDDVKALELKTWFERKTAYKIDVDRFETLPEDVREKIARETEREFSSN